MLYLFVSEAVRAVWRDVRLASRSGFAGSAAARLEVVDPARTQLATGNVFPLYRGTSIGREPTNDIVADDDTVSGEHARLVPRNGRWWIEDLGSTNGTWVNERQVERTRALNSGDLIHLGRLRLRFET